MVGMIDFDFDSAIEQSNACFHLFVRVPLFNVTLRKEMHGKQHRCSKTRPGFEFRDKHENQTAKIAIIDIFDVAPRKPTGLHVAIKAIRRSCAEVVCVVQSSKKQSDIEKAMAHVLERRDVNTVIAIGGTGPNKSDATIQAARSFVHKELTMFAICFAAESLAGLATGSEEWRKLNASMLEGRPLAFITSEYPSKRNTEMEKVVFCLPGHANAVQSSMHVILREVGYLVFKRIQDAKSNTHSV